MAKTRVHRLVAMAALSVALGAVPTTAFASATSGAGGAGGGSGGTTPGCAQLTLEQPQMISGVLRWTGTATNCSTGIERIVMKAADVSGTSIPGCALPPFSYGLPAQSAGHGVAWFMTSRYEPCAGMHTEQVDAYANSSPIPSSSQRITFVTN